MEFKEMQSADDKCISPLVLLLSEDLLGESVNAPFDCLPFVDGIPFILCQASIYCGPVRNVRIRIICSDRMNLTFSLVIGNLEVCADANG